MRRRSLRAGLLFQTALIVASVPATQTCSAPAGSVKRGESIARRRTYWSPDRQVRAVVVFYKPEEYGDGESRVEVWDRSGRRIGLQDYRGGGSHGYCVDRAAWTRDAAFFVFSMQSSGGHQPWHFPTHFFGRRSRKFGLLDALTPGPGIDSGAFHVGPGAKVNVSVLGHPKATFDLRRLSKDQLRKVWELEDRYQDSLKLERR